MSIAIGRFLRCKTWSFALLKAANGNAKGGILQTEIIFILRL